MQRGRLTYKMYLDTSGIFLLHSCDFHVSHYWLSVHRFSYNSLHCHVNATSFQQGTKARCLRFRKTEKKLTWIFLIHSSSVNFLKTFWSCDLLLAMLSTISVKKAFSVIEFPPEDGNTQSAVEAVPTIWINFKDKTCRWPTRRNISALVKDSVSPPGSNWSSFPFSRVFGSYGKVKISNLV